MTKDEALKANEIIDEQMKALEPVWEAALATRNEAQKVLDAIGKMRSDAQLKQIANLRAVVE